MDKESLYQFESLFSALTIVGGLMAMVYLVRLPNSRHGYSGLLDEVYVNDDLENASPQLTVAENNIDFRA